MFFLEIVVQTSVHVFKAVLTFIDIRQYSPGQHPVRYGSTVKAVVPASFPDVSLSIAALFGLCDRNRST